MHPPSLYGPLAETFDLGPEPQLGRDQPLLPTSGEKPLLDYKVEVDSMGVRYTRYASGFAVGPPVGLSMDQYLEMEYGNKRNELWRDQVRRDFRQSSQRQRRQKGSRFEWSVPFAGPKPLRRIVGDEGASLRLNGSRTITIAGKSEWTDGEVQTALGRPSKFPSLSIDQESKFTVEGKVGELINVRINQDTESLGSAFTSSLGDQLANQIKLDYKGDDDAIFQEVQAGNTTLELPATRFVGFRQQNKGLFGIRTKGHLGPLAFTTIASHEKSKSNRKTFKGGAAIDTVSIRDYQYLRNTYFFLDEFYRANLPDFRALAQGAQIRREDFIDPNSLEVYVNDFNTNNDPEQQAREGLARVDFANPREESGWIEQGTWHRLDPDNDYTLVAEAGYIILERPVSESYAMAVIYRTVGGQQLGGKEGGVLRLKLIKARNPRPEFPTWDLEWKNVYRIVSGFASGRKFDPRTLQVEIVKEISGQEPRPSQNGTSYLQILGLDERGQDPGSPADRLIDADYVGLDDIRGYLIFPDQRPFAPRAPRYQTLQETVQAIYTSQQQRDQIEASRYTILVRASSSEQRIRLGGVFGGVRPETVEVRLNGRSLERGSQYNVDFMGNVTFVGNIGQEVADPGADLDITFETDDVLGLGSQQKTLLGLRTEYEFWGGDGRIGSTLLYNNERSSERRVRVGAEPSRTVLWNMDFRARRDAPILTRLVDSVPLLKTAAPSDVLLEAELAQSRPNLNTKGRGYIDDFEGSERPNSLSVGRTKWTPSSLPGSMGYDADNRGRLIWYNPFDGVQRTDVWPGQEEQLEAQNRRTDVLALELRPRQDASSSWGGVVSPFPASNDFSQSKFLEVWVRGTEGVLHIDLGDQINEDYIANGRLDTEDIPFPGRITGDGLVSREEDLGIDGRADEAELVHYLALVGADTTGAIEQRKQRFRELYPQRDADDPEGDNWRYDPNRNRNDYSRINGTQGNKIDLEMGDRPDSEDLNNNGVLDTRNNYYHYTIDLANDAHVPGTESKGWRQFRVPLYGQAVERVGLPDSTRIEYARLMLSSGPLPDPQATIKVEIALVEVVGNEWQEDAIGVFEERFPVGPEESFDVTVIGTDKNPNYHPPPGVRIRRNLQSRTREREQSLVLDYQNLEPGHQMSATRVLTRTTNYTKYTRLRMYVHGDSTHTRYVRGDSSELELFVRFGTDSTNYYEVISPIFPGWEGGRPGWDGNQVDVDLLEISQLKARLQTGRVDPEEGQFSRVYRVEDPMGAPLQGRLFIGEAELERLRAEGFDPRVRLFALDQVYVHPRLRDGQPAVYRVRGTPSMQQIKQLTIGVRHRGSGQMHSGRIFIDEMRLDEARNDPGAAAFARVNTKLADFMNLDAQVQWQGEDFRTASGTGGNGTDMSTSMQASAQMHQFLPGSWGFSIPFKVNLGRTVSLPRFGPGSDVELTPEEKREQQSESSKQFFDVSLSRREGKNPVLRWTVDQMNVRFSHTEEQSSTPVRPVGDLEAQTANFSYRMPLPRPTLMPFAWMPGFVPDGLERMEVRYLPSSLSYSLAGNRRVQKSLQRADADTTVQEEFRANETYAAKLNPLNGLSADYNLRVDRDLRKKFEPGRLSFGREVGRKQTADVSYTLRFISWLDQSYTFKANYDENADPAQRRAQAVIDSTTGRSFQTRDVNVQNDLSARFNVKVPNLLKGLGGSGGSRQTEQGEGPKEAPVQGGPFFLWRLTHFAGDYIEPLNINWRLNTTARNFNLVERPSLLYQFGLRDSLQVRRAAVGLTQQDGSTRSRSLEMGSGLRLPMGVSVKADFHEQLSRRSGSTQSRVRIKEEERFPRLNVSWSRADRLPLIRRVINSANVNISYEVTNSREGEGSIKPRDLINEGDNRDFRASWTGRWRVGPTTTIERVVSLGTSRDFELRSAADTLDASQKPPLRGRGSTEKDATTLSIKHNLRPRSVPLFGKLKSNVDVNFEIGLETERRLSGTGQEQLAPITDIDRWKTQLTLTYNFSENFRGQGLIRVEDNHNNLTDKTRKIREVRLSGTFFLQ